MTKFILIVSCVFTCFSSAGQNVIYVKHDAGGLSDGSSWGDAFTDLQEAINSSNPGDEVWVATGTYYPTEDKDGIKSPIDPRTKTFHLKSGVSLFGGFLGNETQKPSEPLENPSILSGDIGAGGNRNDNVYHVMHNDNINTGATSMTGFIVENGFGQDAGFSDSNGAGLLDEQSEILYDKILFRNNHARTGGGVSASSSFSTFNDCVIRNNHASSHGGGFRDYGSNTIIRNCVFKNNVAGDAGGGYFGLDSQSDMAFCEFKNNTAAMGGGFMLASSDLNRPWPTSVINDVICENNTASKGAGAFLQYRPVYISNMIIRNNSGGFGLAISGHVDIANTLIHDNSGGGANVGYNGFGNQVNFYNTTITHNAPAGDEFKADQYSNVNFYNSIINGEISRNASGIVSYDHCLIPDSEPGGAWDVNLGTDAGGNIDDNPIFFSRADQNFDLWKCSPGVDAGDNTKRNADWHDLNSDNDTLELLPFDAAYYQRVTGVEMDIGAFEYGNTKMVRYKSGNFYSRIDSADAYTWIHCATGQVVGTGPVFAYPSDSIAQYALVVQKGTCTDTSTCFEYDSNLYQAELVIEEPVEIYPNPVGSFLHLNLKSGKFQRGAVYDLSGALILGFEVPAVSHQIIRTEDLPEGIYILKLTGRGEDADFHTKIIKR